jgi:Sap, sulfolipid-1-addressing protein
MWGTVLVLGLVYATDLERLAITVFLMSLPRPMRSLLAYWLGCIGPAIAVGLGVLILLRDFGLIVMQNVTSTVASSTCGRVQIAIGVLALLIAALIAVGFPARQRARVPIGGGDASPPAVQPSTPTLFSQLTARAQTLFSRLTARAQRVLEGGHPWVAFVAGVYSAPQGAGCLMVLTAIMASGAAVGTQVSAFVAFLVVMLAVVEIPLVSYLAMPTKTQAMMLQLQNWVRARRRRIIEVVLAVGGVVLVAKGMGCL